MRYGVTAEEQADGESLDQLLAEEEPDEALDQTEDELTGDERDLEDDGPDPRAGRLVAEDEGAHPDQEEDLVATDAGFAGGAATAEEAAVHVVEDDDTDVRSDYPPAPPPGPAPSPAPG